MKTLKFLCRLFSGLCFILCLGLSAQSLAKGNICTAIHQLGFSTYYPICEYYWKNTIFKKEEM